MSKIIGLSALIFIISCSAPDKSNDVSKDDILKLTQLHGNYRNFWLQNDSSRVVSLFSENGALIPPNNKGGFVTGKKAIGAWWFTKNGDTTYPITSFVYKQDTLVASGNLATWEGVSEVGWETRAKDSLLSVHSSESNFVTVCKKENDEWKIFRQIWNLKPKK